jgi:hypothetical protein
VGGEVRADLVLRTDAGFSPCRTWRYWLSRTWDESRAPLVVIGLNPSTADETTDDPTIRRCMGYAGAWGHGGLVMLNLFAFRATDPRDLKAAHPNPGAVGPVNDYYLSVATKDRRVLCAWGAHGTFLGRADTVVSFLWSGPAPRDLVCLGTTKSGAPKHPLYLRADASPVPFGGVPRVARLRAAAQIDETARHVGPR